MVHSELSPTIPDHGRPTFEERRLGVGKCRIWSIILIGSGFAIYHTQSWSIDRSIDCSHAVCYPIISDGIVLHQRVVNLNFLREVCTRRWYFNRCSRPVPGIPGQSLVSRVCHTLYSYSHAVRSYSVALLDQLTSSC